MEGRREDDSGYEALAKDEESLSTSHREAAHSTESMDTTKKKKNKKGKGKHKEASEDLGHEQEENSTREMKEKEERDSARAEGKGSSSSEKEPPAKKKKKKEKSNEEKLDQEVRKTSPTSSNLRPVRKLRNLFYVVDGSRYHIYLLSSSREVFLVSLLCIRVSVRLS